MDCKPILAVLLIASPAIAGRPYDKAMEPVTWVSVSDPTEQYAITVFWNSQFEDNDGTWQHLIMVSPRATWDGLSVGQSRAIIQQISTLLDGKGKASMALLNVWAHPQQGVNKAVIVVAPDEPPQVIGDAVYWIACPVGKRATALLGEWGLMPPPSEDLP